MARGFLESYSGMISLDVESKTNSWYDGAHEIKTLRPFFKRRLIKSAADFKKFANHQGGAYDLLLSLDITIRCLEALSFHAASSLVSCTNNLDAEQLSNSEDKTIGHWRSVTALSLYLNEMSESVFHLVMNNKDVAARIVSRSAFEAADYFLAIQDDHSLAIEYGKSSGDFRRLWNNSLRNYKVNELRRKALKGLLTLDDEALQADTEFRKECFEDFSQAVHPSYDAGTMILFSAMSGSSSGEWSFLNDWTHRRVVASMVYACMLPASIELIQIGAECQNKAPIQLNLRSKESEKYVLGVKAATALLQGLLLAYSIT